MLKYIVIEVKSISIKPLYSFTGSTIRGVFGRGLRYVCCPYINGECKQCEIYDSCVYYEFFENLQITPNFKLDIVLNSNTFDFKIFLFEHATNYVKQVLIAIKNMAEIGFGVDRKPFQFKQLLLNSNNITKYNIQDINHDTLTFTPKLTAGDYHITTLTPIRMKQNAKFIRSHMDFKLFIHQIAMRFATIVNKPIIKHEAAFEHIEQNFNYYNITRYSNRQECKMDLSGVMGQVTVYKLDDYSAKLLELATIINVGKSTTFGLGKIDVKRI